MTTKELSTRTLRHLRLLAKELDVKNPNSYSKDQIINLIHKKGKRNISNAESRIQDTEYSYMKKVPFYGRFLNRKILILLGILLAIYGLFSLLNKKLTSNYFYSDIQFIGNIEFKTIYANRKKNIVYKDEMIENPLCGCKNELPHYGLTFFTYDYSISFQDSLNNPIFPSIEISAPNHVIVSYSNEREEENKKIVDASFDPFEISFDYFKISEVEFYLEEENLRNFIISKYNAPSFEVKHINEVNGIKIREMNSDIQVVSMDDVFMSSFTPPYGTVLNISRKISNIQDRLLKGTIESDFSLIDKNKFWRPSFDILGRVNAYVFKRGIITDIDDKPILEKITSKDSIIVLVAKSGFSQKILPQTEDNGRYKKTKIVFKHPISDEDYYQLLEKFDQRRDGFYKDILKNANLKVSLVTPFVQNKPNGIHYYGEFEYLISTQTKGKIQLGKLTETIDFPKSINFLNVDTMKLFTEPLVFQSNPNSDFKNSLMTSGKLKISETEVKLSITEKIISYAWYFLDSFIGFFGSLFGLVKGLKGLSFSFKLKKTAYNNV